MLTVIPIETGALGTVPKGLEKRLKVLEIGGRIEIIKTTALFRLFRILRRVLEIWGDFAVARNPIKYSLRK